MADTLDLVIYVNAGAIGGASTSQSHRLPVIKSLSHHLSGKGQVLVVTHYLSLLVDPILRPKRAINHFSRPTELRLADNLHVWTPSALLNLSMARHFPPLLKLNRAFLKRQLGQTFRRLGFASSTPRVAWVSHPYHLYYLGLADEACSVYDCYEDFSLFGLRTRDTQVQDLERRLASKVDLILANARVHESKLRPINSRTHYFPFGVDIQRFLEASSPAVPVADELAAIPRPIIGFAGCLKASDDFDLLRQVIGARPQWSFVFIGEVAAPVRGLFESLKDFSNVYPLGWQKAERLASFLKGFDVGMMPFRLNELTQTFNPYKMYDYMAAGVPIVSTPITEVLRFNSVVEIGEGAPQFIAAIERGLSRPRAQLGQTYSSIIRIENWDERASFAMDLFRRVISGPGPRGSGQATRLTAGTMHP